MKGWVCIHTENQVFRAELCKNALTVADVPAVLLNQRDSSYGFGELALWVPEQEADRAKSILGLDGKPVEGEQ